MKIRDAVESDVPAIGSLAEQAADYFRNLGDTTNFQLNARTVERDGFGENPAFKLLVSDVTGEVVGYLMYYFGYDSDRATRMLHVADLFVRSADRMRGVGRALMTRAGEICVAAGGTGMAWSVYTPNLAAFRFYERLGAKRVKDTEFMYLQLVD